MPVNGSPVFSTTILDLHSTSPRPPNAVSFQPARDLPSSNRSHPSPSKGALGAASAFCRVSISRGVTVRAVSDAGAFVVAFDAPGEEACCGEAHPLKNTPKTTSRPKCQNKSQ